MVSVVDATQSLAYDPASLGVAGCRRDGAPRELVRAGLQPRLPGIQICRNGSIARRRSSSANC